MKKSTKINIVKHLSVIILFIVTSLLFFSPVIKGKKIFQQDIMLYDGMAKELRDFREKNGEETYWINNAFSGMPTFQLGAKFPHNYIKKLDLSLRFLPRPADYIFLYLLCFYILCLSLKVEYRLAVLGSLAFAFSTYLIIIIGVGHNAKAHAIGYMPLVIAGIITVFKRKYFLGFILSTIALGLQFSANHFQMTYYLMFMVIILGLYYLIDHYKRNELRSFIKSILILFGALFLSISMNASVLMSTYEYSKESQRGKSELTINPDGKEKDNITSGLSKEYITQYSYGKFEILNLFIPRIMGGASTEKLDRNSSFYKALKDSEYAKYSNEIIKNSPTYWGNQPGVAAPAYLGITVFFLFVFSIFLTHGREKKWILTAIFISLLLSFGKNLEFLTDFFIDYFPYYDKFRAVTSIQVIVELCVPLLAIIGLHRFFKNDGENHLKYLYYTIISFIVLLLLLYFGKEYLNFSGLGDKGLDEVFLSALVIDRKEMYDSDLFRTLIYISVVFGILFLYLKKIIKKNITIISIGLIIMIDLISFSKNYVNDENFVEAARVEQPFDNDYIYNELEKDKSDYRVFDKRNQVVASYFSKSVYGYSAVKLKSYDDVLNFYFLTNRDNSNVLSMLNTKYIIGNEFEFNTLTSGSAWFIKTLEKVPNRNEEILALETLDFRNKAISKDLEPKNYILDNSSYVELLEKSSNHVKYKINNNNDGFVVFSEIFYPYGWVSTIDGMETPHHRVNYILRGMQVPNGEHIIEFRFDPQVVKTSSKISLASTSIFILLIVLFGYLKFRKV